MQKLISDLLIFSRQDEMNAVFSDVNLNDLLLDVLSDMEVEIEKHKAQIRIEMLNLTNTPKFREPDAVLGSSTFGKITRQGGFSRLTQITLRMFW